MIAHNEFSRLRLRDFCGGDGLYTEERDEHGGFVFEMIRGIDFARPVCRLDETFIINVDLLDYSTDAGPAILAELGIPLTRDSTVDDVTTLLGKPTTNGRHDPDDYCRMQSDTYEFRVGPESGYVVRCTFIEPGARDVLACYQVLTRSLWQVHVERGDLRALFPEE